MYKMKIVVPPSILFTLLAMLIIVFFFTLNHEPVIIKVDKVDKNYSIEKSADLIYDMYPGFPYVDESERDQQHAPFVMDGNWWTYDLDDDKFIQINLKY